MQLRRVISIKYRSMKNQNPNRFATERRLLPFFIDFVKFATGFAAIIAVALLTLHAASAAVS